MKQENKNPNELHISVLLNELVNSININKTKQNIIVDCTLWMWWHASEVIKKLNSWDIFIWFDADIRNLEIASEKLKILAEKQKVSIFFINDNFSNLKNKLEELDIKKNHLNLLWFRNLFSSCRWSRKMI